MAGLYPSRSSIQSASARAADRPFSVVERDRRVALAAVAGRPARRSATCGSPARTSPSMTARQARQDARVAVAEVDHRRAGRAVERGPDQLGRDDRRARRRPPAPRWRRTRRRRRAAPGKISHAVAGTAVGPADDAARERVAPVHCSNPARDAAAARSNEIAGGGRAALTGGGRPLATSVSPSVTFTAPPPSRSTVSGALERGRGVSETSAGAAADGRRDHPAGVAAVARVVRAR